MSLDEAVDDAENLTDFLMDFEEDEWFCLDHGLLKVSFVEI